MRKTFFLLALCISFFILVGCAANRVSRSSMEGMLTLSDGLDDNGFFKGIRALDYVELFDYRALQIPSDASIGDYVHMYLMNEVIIHSMPEVVLKRQENITEAAYRITAALAGMELEEYLDTHLEVSGVDELLEENRENNMQEASFFLALQAVAEDAGLTVTREDAVNYFYTDEHIPYIGNVIVPVADSFAAAEDMAGLPYWKHMALAQKTFNYIVANAVDETSQGAGD